MKKMGTLAAAAATCNKAKLTRTDAHIYCTVVLSFVKAHHVVIFMSISHGPLPPPAATSSHIKLTMSLENEEKLFGQMQYKLLWPGFRYKHPALFQEICKQPDMKMVVPRVLHNISKLKHITKTRAMVEVSR